jgi:hypothetical protein
MALAPLQLAEARLPLQHPFDYLLLFHAAGAAIDPPPGYEACGRVLDYGVLVRRR